MVLFQFPTRYNWQALGTRPTNIGQTKEIIAQAAGLKQFLKTVKN